jgi:hypothetical protein
MVLALHALPLSGQTRREERGRIKVFLHIADDLRGSQTGGFVDGCSSCGISLMGGSDAGNGTLRYRSSPRAIWRPLLLKR